MQYTGTLYWCTILVLCTGAVYWYTILVHYISVEYWWPILVHYIGVKYWCTILVHYIWVQYWCVGVQGSKWHFVVLLSFSCRDCGGADNLLQLALKADAPVTNLHRPPISGRSAFLPALERYRFPNGLFWREGQAGPDSRVALCVPWNSWTSASPAVQEDF